jgi:hypothetical protein
MRLPVREGQFAAIASTVNPAATEALADDFASPTAPVEELADFAGNGGDRGVEGDFSHSIPFVVDVTSY